MYPNQPEQQPGTTPPPGFPPQQPPAQPSAQGVPQTPVSPVPPTQQQPTPSPYPYGQQPHQQWNQPLPSQPQQPTSDMASIDYLDQIATPQKSRFSFSRKQLLIGGGILIALLFTAVFMALTSARPNITAQSIQLVNTIASTIEITKSASKNLKSGQLVSLNSTLQSQLMTAASSLPTSLAAIGVTIKPVEGTKALPLEGGQAIADTLEEARLLSTYDRVYVRELTYRVSQIMTQLNAIHARTDSQSVKKDLEATYSGLKLLHEQLTEFGAARDPSTRSDS